MFHDVPAIILMMPLFAIVVIAMIGLGNRPRIRHFLRRKIPSNSRDEIYRSKLDKNKQNRAA